MNKTKSTTVKRSFTLNLIFFLVAYVAIVAGIGYWVWLNTLKFENEAIRRTQQHLLTIAKSESRKIEEFIDTTLYDAKILAKDPLVIKYLKYDLKAKSTSEADYYTEEYLFEHLGGKVDFIHWLNAKGIVLGGFPFVEEIIGRDESRDPGVKFMLENHILRIDVHEANPGNRFLCICNPVIENGNFLGLTRVLVSLETINNLVSTVRAGEKGYAWVISEQGIMMAHPKPEHRGVDIMAIRKKAFPDFDWSELEGIVNKMESGEEGVGTYQSAWWTEEKLEIVRKLTAFSPIKISAGQELWSIGVSLSYYEIAGPIKRNALNNFIGAGSILLVFSIGGIILFRVQRKRAEMEIIARSAEELRVLNKRLQSEITERKQAEKLIKSSRDYLQKLNDSLGAVIFTVKMPERVVEYVNCTVESVFGYKPDECIGKETKVLYPAVEEYHDFGRSLGMAIKEGKNELKVERLFKRKNGEIFPCEVTTTFLRENEEIVRVISILHDITERKKMEEELVKMQKLESVGVLAGGIAHDFNNYLQGILSNIAIAKSHIDSNDKIYTNLAESEKAVIQAKQLSKQLLTFSKGGEPIKKLFSAIDLIKDSASFALSGSNIKCEFDLPDCHCLIEADKGQMNQVFNNLFINANHAMSAGATIKVKVEEINIEARNPLPLQERKHVKISIKDQGIGIPRIYLQKIFDPYFTTKKKGTGLGLAITYSIIKKHDGLITVESEVGIGTTFNIYLPVSQEEIRKGQVISDIPVKKIGKESITHQRRILLMDDDGIIRLSVAQQLRDLKYKVETAKDGEKAIELYKVAVKEGKPFDVVLMDLTIPGKMGGKEAIKILLEIDPNARAIVASGYSNDPIMTNFSEYGFKGVVEKPYEIYELQEVLQKVIMEKQI